MLLLPKVIRIVFQLVGLAGNYRTIREFGKDFFDKVITDSDCEQGSIVATFTELSAISIFSALDSFVTESVDEIWVAGGGVHNDYLMGRLRQLFSGVAVRSLVELGLNPDAREAVCFAVLAY